MTHSTPPQLCAALVHENAIERLRVANLLRSAGTITIVCVAGSLNTLDEFIDSNGVPDVVLFSPDFAETWPSLGVSVVQPHWDNAFCSALALPEKCDAQSLTRWLVRTLEPTLVTVRLKRPLSRVNGAGVQAAPTRQHVREDQTVALRTRGDSPAPSTSRRPSDACTPTCEKDATSDVHRSVSEAIGKVQAIASARKAGRAGDDGPIHHQATRRSVPESSDWQDAPTVPQTAARAVARWNGASIVVFASSTGGPDALAVVLSSIPASLPVPILIVQHMGARFTEGFAQRLDRLCAAPVRLVTDGAVPGPGEVWLAPGDKHVALRRVDGQLACQLLDSPEVHGCRPAADVTFLSLAQEAPGQTLAVVLTGMGEDGAAGAEALRNVGCHVLVQDEQSSVVWGMPGAVVKRGAANEVLPLRQIAARMMSVVTSGLARSVAIG